MFAGFGWDEAIVWLLAVVGVAFLVGWAVKAARRHWRSWFSQAGHALLRLAGEQPAAQPAVQPLPTRSASAPSRSPVGRVVVHWQSTAARAPEGEEPGAGHAAGVPVTQWFGMEAAAPLPSGGPAPARPQAIEARAEPAVAALVDELPPRTHPLTDSPVLRPRTHPGTAFGEVDAAADLVLVPSSRRVGDGAGAGERGHGLGQGEGLGLDCAGVSIAAGSVAPIRLDHGSYWLVHAPADPADPAGAGEGLRVELADRVHELAARIASSPYDVQRCRQELTAVLDWAGRSAPSPAWGPVVVALLVPGPAGTTLYAGQLGAGSVWRQPGGGEPEALLWPGEAGGTQIWQWAVGEEDRLVMLGLAHGGQPLGYDTVRSVLRAVSGEVAGSAARLVGRSLGQADAQPAWSGPASSGQVVVVDVLSTR